MKHEKTIERDDGSRVRITIRMGPSYGSDRLVYLNSVCFL